MDTWPGDAHHADMDAMTISMVVAVFVLAGCVKGITGMGLPTVAMSLLGLWMPPAQAAALLVLPSLATNVAQCRGPHLRSLTRRLWPGWLAIGAVTAWAPGLGDGASAASASRWLGAVLVAYGVWGWSRPTLPDLSGRGHGLAALAGLVTGAVTACTAVFVLPWVPYLQSLRLDKDAMVQALGLSFTVATLALAARLQVTVPVSWGAAMGPAWTGALLGAFAGMKTGEVLRGRLAGPGFQKAMCLVFVLLGCVNLVRVG